MSEPFVGEIRMFGFGRIPNGWLACDGSLQSIAEYEVLYVLLGTTYGGDGQNSFALPDLRGRVPLHQGTGPGLSTRVLGERSGTEQVTLLTLNLPGHNHTFMADAAAATASTPDATQTLGALAADTQYLTDTTGAAMYPLQPSTIGVSGGNQPHDNCMPTLTVSICIATSGIFPTQQ
ncbi:MAG: phage tail protein [Brevundimonas sp.]|nr:MAG: phage tail protein [Brevundimonas sp.]